MTAYMMPTNAMIEIPLTWAEAQRRVESAVASDGSRRNMIAAARRAIVHIVGVERLHDANMWPLLSLLPWAAEQVDHAEEDGSRVKSFVGYVSGWRPGKTNKGSSNLILHARPEWRPLLEAARLLGRDRCWLADLSRMNYAAGTLDAPVALASVGALRDAGRRLGLSDKHVQQVFTEWRSVRAAAINALPELEDTYPPLFLPQHTLSRHLAAAPRTAALLREVHVDPKRVGTRDAVKILSPLMHASLDVFPDRLARRATQFRLEGTSLEAGAQRKGRRRMVLEAATLLQVRQSVNVVLGAMARCTREEIVRQLGTIQPLDFIMRDVVVNRAIAVLASAPDAFDLARASVGNLPVAPNNSASESEAVPLLLYLMQEDAATSRAASPLGATVGFTQAQLKDVHAIRLLAEVVHAEELRGSARHTFEARYKHIEATVSGGIARADDGANLAVKDKQRALACMSLPLVACVGLPLLRRRVVRLRAEWLRLSDVAARAIAEGHAEHGISLTAGEVALLVTKHVAVRRAKRAYAKLLTRVVFLALCLADGLRCKQYTKGRLGKHFHLELSADGATVARVSTSWTGQYGDVARVKNHTKRRSTYSRINETVPPGVLDLELFGWYLTDVRAPRLISAGLAADGYGLTESAAERGEFPLFLGGAYDRLSEKRDAGLDATAAKARIVREIRAGVTVRHVSTDWVGVTLHELARDVFAVAPSPIPPRRPGTKFTLDLAGHEGEAWRALFSVHILRLLLGSHMCLVWGDTALAARKTSDEVATLLGEYADMEVRRNFPKGDPRRSDSFDHWLRPIYTENAAPELWHDPAWRSLVSRLPKASAMIESDEKREARRTRIRRARPGQNSPSSRSAH